MEIKRKLLQGVLNIIRFNWHFYVVIAAVLITLALVKNLFSQTVQSLIVVGILLSITAVVTSLLVSLYVYDLSDLYQLNWIGNADNKRILNINAGFDETSEIIKEKYPGSDITICDFYDPAKHTEVSIKRARQAYPPNPQTIVIKTDQLPFPENTFDRSLVILSAHEIRCDNERTRFFRELHRVTKPYGQILVTEHLRDLNNFLAYTVGVSHFYSRSSWLQTFGRAHLIVKQELKITPFITTFILEKDWNYSLK